LGCERRGATIRRRTSTRSPGQGGGVKGEVEKAEPASCSAWTIPALLHWTSDPGTRKDHGTRNGAGKEIQEAITARAEASREAGRESVEAMNTDQRTSTSCVHDRNVNYNTFLRPDQTSDGGHNVTDSTRHVQTEEASLRVTM
jgi:hypothetical protein